ncbi:MAG: PDZ domain-containing protein [Brumimicrobium sp.]
MKKISLLFTTLILGASISAQTIHHKLSMPEPQTHYFHVQMELEDFEEEELVISIPVWTPGSYLVREFSKNINLVHAKDKNGNALEIDKTRKNKWKIEKGTAKKVVVNYEVYAFELTVRTSFLDLTHGYLNGTNVFMYPEEYKSLGGKLTVTPHDSFKKITTSLPKSGDGVANDSGTTFTFDDYDHLADSPIEIGNQEEFSFDAAGVKHNVAMYGPGNYDIEELKTDMAKVVETTTAIFGENPNEEYWFIIHNTENGGGGLEHKNSTTLNVNRWSYDEENYLGFLSLVAHEYFHLWNVKRIRPIELGPFDYDNENYTDLLWVMEGFTSYYDELILKRAGFYDQEKYLNVLKGTMNYVESSPGNKVQPVAHASFDAWIKAYRPNENSKNTTISYYSKGHLVAAVIEAMIIKESKGKKSIDDFMQLLYKKFYQEKKRGFTSGEFQSTLEEFIGLDLEDFFQKHVYGTETIDYKKYFEPLGLEIELTSNASVAFGVSTSESSGRLIIRSVTSNSMAESVGISPNDEIIAFNGFRVDSKSFGDFLEALEPNNEFNLIISRDNQLMTIDAQMGMVEIARYDFEFDDKNKLGKFWLREKM